METTTLPKLSLNKRVISKLDNYSNIPRIIGMESEDNRCSADCTFIECASVPMCRTNIYKSCAPCVPPPPLGTTKPDTGGGTKGR